jgi:hypothetical protein
MTRRFSPDLNKKACLGQEGRKSAFVSFNALSACYEPNEVSQNVNHPFDTCSPRAGATEVISPSDGHL